MTLSGLLNHIIQMLPNICFFLCFIQPPALFICNILQIHVVNLPFQPLNNNYRKWPIIIKTAMQVNII